VAVSMPDLESGLSLFNQKRFFDAHEALEDVWRELPRHHIARRHLQGLVQLAVAFHHQSTGNLVGALSVLERATGNLDAAEETFPDLDLARLRNDLASWLDFLRNFALEKPAAEASSFSDQRPSLPQIRKIAGRNLHGQNLP
jgi:hypothetical protein